MKNLESTWEGFDTQEKLEEIGNKFYERLVGLYHDVVNEIKEVYDTFAMASDKRSDRRNYGQRTGDGRGRGTQDGGRRNINKKPCKKGPGYGKGGGRGSGKNR